MSICVDELKDLLCELDGSLVAAVDGAGFLLALDDDERVEWSVALPVVVEGVEIS